MNAPTDTHEYTEARQCMELSSQQGGLSEMLETSCLQFLITNFNCQDINVYFMGNSGGGRPARPLVGSGQRVTHA
jgi:hypothetical protein